MPDSIEARVRTVIADVLDAPPELVRPETSLSLADLGWKGFLMITLEIEHEFGVAMPVEVPNGWTSVADVIMATERAIAAAAPARSAA
jgi:acyl carrier protein